MQPAAAAGRVCPLYVVCESRSGPEGKARAREVVDALMDVADHFARKPAFGDVVRVAALGLGRGLEQVQPLSSPAGWRRTDLRLRPKGPPAYQSVFADLDGWLSRDRRVLEGRGQLVQRPVVLLLVHAGPDSPDTWRPSWELLLRSPWAPVITALCGAREAVDFADAVIHPTDESRAYQSAGDFGAATVELITQIGQRLFDGGGTAAGVAGLLPDTAELNGTAVARASAGAPEPALAALSPPEPPAEDGPVVVPDTFFFDRRLGTFVTERGAATVDLRRRDVERAVVRLLDGGAR